MYQLQTINVCENSVFNVDLALNWLGNSGIQSPAGGFYADYNEEENRYSYLYPKITGYAIQLFTRLYSLDNKVIYLAKAIKAGDWLLSVQNENGSFFSKYYDAPDEETHEDSLYVFDSGMTACGLVDLYKVTSKERYLKTAVKTMDFALKFQNSNGSFNAGLKTDDQLLDSHQWTQTSSCHHLKMMIPLLRLYKFTEDKKYLDSARRLLRWGCTLQNPDGRFIVYSGSDETYAHAHCYALEGIVAAYKYFGNTNLDLAIRINRGLSYLMSEQNSDGSICNWSGNHENKMKVSEALSQTLRLLLLRQKGLTLSEKMLANDKVQKGFSFLGKMQQLESGIRRQGGISLGETNGQIEKTICTCATIFAIHAALLIELGKRRQSFEAIV